MYKKLYKYCPSFNIFIVSSEKDENVVKPPQIPVAKNKRHSGDTLNFSDKPNIIPITKQPKILTVKVPNGKADKNLD